MTTSTPQILRDMHNASRAIGSSAIASDATFEIEGFESMALLTPQFPMPVPTTQGVLEMPGPLGTVMAQPLGLKVNHESPITLRETTAGNTSDELLDILLTGRQFNAKLYDKRSERTYWLFRCSFRPDSYVFGKRDRSQPLQLCGYLFYNYDGTCPK